MWAELRQRAGIFAGAAAWSATRFNVSQTGETQYVDGLWASGGFFDMLGVPAILGRTFNDTDDVRGAGPAGPVAVITTASASGGSAAQPTPSAALSPSIESRSRSSASRRRSSLWASRFVATPLYGLQPRDPVTLVGAAVVLASVGALAGWLPARRGSIRRPYCETADASADSLRRT